MKIDDRSVYGSIVLLRVVRENHGCHFSFFFLRGLSRLVGRNNFRFDKISRRKRTTVSIITTICNNRLHV